MKIHPVRLTAATALTLGVLFAAGCGDDEGAGGDAGPATTATQPATAKQMLDLIVEKCIASAAQAPDKAAREQGEAACRAAGADAPVGPGAPNSDQITQRLREECEQAAKDGMSADVKATCDGLK